MGVDFHWISTAISRGGSNNGFGTIVSFPSAPSGGGCPAAGTPTGSVVTQTYEDGSTVYVTQLGSSYKNQNADFAVLNDGTCGTYVSTSSPSNIVFKPNGTLVANGSWYEYTVGSTVTVLGTAYYSQEARDTFLHDGSGGYSEYTAAGVQYKPMNTFIVSEPEVFPVPEVGGSNYSTGRTTNYYHNGEGGVMSSISGDYYSSGTLIWQNVTNSWAVPLPSMNPVDGGFAGNRYEWNGAGVYVEFTTWYVPYGTFIEEYNGENYYHDGNANYYSVPI
jgi:hypothetical protein